MRFDYNSLYLRKFRDGDLPCSCGPKDAAVMPSPDHWSLIFRAIIFWQGRIQANSHLFHFLSTLPNLAEDSWTGNQGLEEWCHRNTLALKSFQEKGWSIAATPNISVLHMALAGQAHSRTWSASWVHTFQGIIYHPPTTRCSRLGGRPPFCVVRLVVEGNFLPSFW